jgi:hypothetical protein
MTKTSTTWVIAGIAITAGLAAAFVAIVDRRFLTIGVIVGAICLFVVSTLLSRAARIARPLQELRGRTVDVQVWGAPLPGAGEGTLRLESARAFGAGLLLRLRRGGSGDLELLKVAQPTEARFHPHGVEIADAAYVQWAGARLPRLSGAPALALRVADPSGTPDAPTSPESWSS